MDLSKAKCLAATAELDTLGVLAGLSKIFIRASGLVCLLTVMAVFMQKKVPQVVFGTFLAQIG